MNCCCEWRSLVVATSIHGFEAVSCSLRDVTTSAIILCLKQVVVLGVATSVFLSRHHLMLLKVALVVNDVATSVLLSRHYSFNLCSFLSCLRCDPCRDLHQIPFNLSNVATSELDCLDLKTASIAQPVAFISALL